MSKEQAEGLFLFFARDMYNSPMAVFKLTKKLDHIAFIMDGNGRWAKAKGLPRYLGHKRAVEILTNVFDACMDYNIKVISCYAFSTENWNRPQDEINHLMDYLEEFLEKKLPYLMEKGAQIRISGDLSRIRETTRAACYKAMDATKDNKNWIINVCLNYGSRDEIVKAVKAIAEGYKDGKIALSDIDEETFKDYLYTKGLPDVDLMVRTSGEERLSNFLLYQNAYAEFVFTPTKWPDFDKKALTRCLKEYEGRKRRYGGLKDE